MSFRPFRALALLSCVTLAACGEGSRIVGLAGSTNAATVRFVNATGSALDLATNGVVTTPNANIAPGAGVGCFSVEEPAVPGLTVRQAGTTTDLPGFAPVFGPAGFFTVVAFPGPSGSVQFLTLPGSAVPISGRSALRVVNASTGLGVVDVHVTSPGGPIGTPAVGGIAFGGTSIQFDVGAGTVQVRLTNTGSTTLVFDAGNRVLDAGISYTLIVSSATAAILVPDCI